MAAKLTCRLALPHLHYQCKLSNTAPATPPNAIIGQEAESINSPTLKAPVGQRTPTFTIRSSFTVAAWVRCRAQGGGEMSHDHQHQPLLLCSQGPRHGPQRQLWLVLTMAPCGTLATYKRLLLQHHLSSCCTSCSTSLPSDPTY